jgi:hypothetical protein
VRAAFEKDITHPIQVDTSQADEPLQLLTADQMRQLPRQRFLLEPFLVEHGTNTLVGAPGTWKSFMALSWAAQVDGPVVYICREGVGDLVPRLDAFCDGNELATADQVYFLTDEVQLPADVDRVAAAIGGLQPALIVVDTVTDASAGVDENGPDMKLFHNAMRTLSQTFDCATLSLTHTGWDGRRERGHSSQRGMADNTMLLERNGTDDAPGPVARLMCRKMRHTVEFTPRYYRLHTPEPAKLLDRPMPYLVEADADDWRGMSAEQRNERADQLVEAFGSEPFSVQQAAELWNIGRSTAGHHLRSLAGIGRAEKCHWMEGKRGMWRVLQVTA